MTMMNEDRINELYTARFKTLAIIASNIEKELKGYAKIEEVSRIDRIGARAKSIDRFMGKALKIEEDKKGNKTRKYADPINQIQDQIGARIITFYLDDVDVVIEKLVRKYYRSIEERLLIPDSEKEFGYEGKHFILHIPKEVLPEVDKDFLPKFFELQVKTLHQHAFSEASHDLAYKPGVILTKEQKRKVAFAAAQAWGADMIFDELSKESFEK